MELPGNTQEKSIMLARLMGWQFVYAGNGVVAVVRDKIFVGTTTAYWYSESGPCVDFYEKDNMSLAWKILAFAADLDQRTNTTVFEEWWHSQRLYLKSPEKAQKLWLDKVLELAIQAEEILPD